MSTKRTLGTLDKRGVRRMLVTTLGRIERIEGWLAWADLPEKDKPGLRADLAKQQQKLKEYNTIAAQLIAQDKVAK